LEGRDGPGHVASACEVPIIGKVTRAQAPYPFEPYRPSGRLGRAELLPFAGLTSAAFAGFVYGWLLAQTPCSGFEGVLFLLWLLLRIVLVLAFAYAMALSISYAGHLLRVRNVAMLLLYGALTALLGIWCSWVVYLWALQQILDPDQAEPLLDWLQSPAGVWRNIEGLAAGGVHSIPLAGQDTSPSGIWLWLAWMVEALMVVVVCVVAAPRRMRNRAFCEKCGRWMDVEPPLHLVSSSSLRDVRRHGLDVLREVTPPHRDAAVWTRIGRQRCRQCSAGVFCVDQVLRFEQQGLARAAAAHDLVLHALLAPLSGTRMAVNAESVVSLVWQGPTEQAVLQRVAGELDAHPLSRLQR